MSRPFFGNQTTVTSNWSAFPWMLWISSFYFFFGLEKNLATKYVDKNFQILKPKHFSLTQGVNHWKKSHKSSCQGSNGSPQAFATPAETWFLNFAAFWKPHGVSAKNRNSSKCFNTSKWRMIEVASEQNQSRKVGRGETSKFGSFFVSQRCKVNGERQTKSGFFQASPFSWFTKLLWRSRTCFDL